MTESTSSRRAFLATSLTAIAALAAGNRLLAQPAKGAVKAAAIPKDITIYKDPNCGCCADWVKHLKANGFVTTVRDTADMQTVKVSMGVPAALGSCHTARVGTYVIEGHVPADVIVRALTEKPAGLGLAVPGMPMGSPGMEQGGRKDKYDVMLFDKTGKAKVYASR